MPSSPNGGPCGSSAISSALSARRANAEGEPADRRGRYPECLSAGEALSNRQIGQRQPHENRQGRRTSPGLIGARTEMRHEGGHPARGPAGTGSGRAAQDSEARYRAFFEHSPVAIVLTDGRRILLANPAALAMMRAASAAEVVGLDALRFVHADSLPVVRERVAALLAAPGISVPFI